MTLPQLRLARRSGAVPDARAARLSRLSVLDGFGAEGVRRLSDASVLVVGAGGLGCPALLGLASNGFGRIGVIDDDVVEASNLARQVLHRSGRIGTSKAASATAALLDFDSAIEVEAIAERFEPSSADRLLAGWDLVVDTVDDFPTHYAIADASARAGIPHVWGSVIGFDAMASVFWAGHGPTLRDVFPDEDAAAPDSCALTGVLSTACAELGALLAGEAAKLVVGVGEPLVGRVVVQDALTGRRREIPVEPSASTAARTPPTPVVRADAAAPVPSIETGELAELLAAGGAIRLVDVRPLADRAVGFIGEAPGLELDAVLAAPDGDGEVVVYCTAGIRSLAATRRLVDAGIPARSLAGGFRAWTASASLRAGATTDTGPEASAHPEASARR